METEEADYHEICDISITDYLLTDYLSTDYLRLKSKKYIKIF